ncbi:MAG: hypothetical protein INH34_05225 [Phycisphaerales bacterium]|nr:hypothetical protein [Phycisphaerales bacterium]
MSDPALARKRLVERVLADGGDLPLTLLLEHAVPVAALRELARELGLTPKGGFRLAKAPAKVLAALFAEQRDAEVLDKVLQLLLPAAGAPAAAPAAEADGGAAAGAAKPDPLLALRDAEIARLRAELDRAREAQNRAHERDTDLQRQLDAANDELARRRAEAAQPKVQAPPPLARDAKELQRQIKEVASENEGLREADRALRRQLAFDQTRIRELEAEVTELDALLPKGKRRRKPQPEPAAAAERRFRLPRFLPSFYKSLEGKERKAVERAVQAVLLFCTEGHGYPGLEVKQMGGQDTWSLRASLGLRVYFRHRDDGDVEVLELADREDQHTTLRRLKERG